MLQPQGRNHLWHSDIIIGHHSHKTAVGLQLLGHHLAIARGNNSLYLLVAIPIGNRMRRGIYLRIFQIHLTVVPASANHDRVFC